MGQPTTLTLPIIPTHIPTFYVRIGSSRFRLSESETCTALSTFLPYTTCSGDRVLSVLPPALQRTEEGRLSNQATFFLPPNHLSGGTREAQTLNGEDPK